MGNERDGRSAVIDDERRSRATGGANRGGQAWRAIIAALANDDLRAAYAGIVLGHAPTQEHRTAQLVRAGLVELRDGAAVPVVDGLRSILADRAPERPQRGPERFLRVDGSIDRYPSQHGDREELLRFVVAAVLAPDERLTEPELNERLRRFDEDTALLRRYLVDYGMLDRTRSGSEYHRTGSEGPSAASR